MPLIIMMMMSKSTGKEDLFVDRRNAAVGYCYLIVFTTMLQSKKLFADRTRPAYYHWYYRKSWKVLRTNQLRKEPCCRACDNNHIITVATEVDHIIPHKGVVSRFFDELNLQSLCKSCHSRKTTIENNPHAKPKPIIGNDGWPK